MNHITKLLPLMSEEVRNNFLCRITFSVNDSEEEYEQKNKFKYKCLLTLLTPDSIARNRYFCLVDSFLSSFDYQNKRWIKKYVASNPLPPQGSGWRKIKRWLKEYDRALCLRVAEYSYRRDAFGHLNLGGRFIEGKELADLTAKRNLCLKHENPSSWSSSVGWLLMPDGVLAKISFDEEDLDYVVDEIQGESNNWNTEDQLSYFHEKTKPNKDWAFVLGWWDLDELIEYGFRSYIKYLHEV